MQPDPGIGTLPPRYHEASPPALSAFVRRVWSLDLPAASTPERIVPDGCCEIVFTLDGQVLGSEAGERLNPRPAAILVGQMSRPTLVQAVGAVRLVGIRLHPWAAAEFLGLAAGDFTDQVVDLRLASPALHTLLRPVADRDGDPAVAVTRVIAALSAYAGGRPRPCPAARLAVEMIRGNPAVGVSQLARWLGWSERRLQRTFAAQVGIPPKTLARITRVQHAIRVAEARPQQTWASIAAGCGYVDQPHLVREFGQLAGCTPTALRAEPQPLRDRLLLRD
jgi:AraC-like DNA-binding protein